MEADVRTVEKVDIGRFTVSVGETTDGRYEAAVVGTAELETAIRRTAGLRTVASDGETPIVSAPAKYTAIGRAVDAALDGGKDANPDTPSGSDSVTVEIEGSEDDGPTHTEWSGALYCEVEQSAICNYDDWGGADCPYCGQFVPATGDDTESGGEDDE